MTLEKLLLHPTVALLIAVSAASTCYAAEEYVTPRTEYGHPDLQGIWTNATQTPLERPRELGEKAFFTNAERLAQEEEWREYIARRQAPSDPDRDAPDNGVISLADSYDNFWVDRGTEVIEINGEFRTSIVIDPPDGRIPYAEGARARILASFRSGTDGPEARPLAERCIMSFGSPGGPPMLPVMYNNNYQIVQTQDYVMILVEMVHDARIIPLNKEHATPFPSWLGESVGHWEDDTLVVETTNIRPEQLFRGATDNLVVEERFTRVADGKIVYRFTMNDPEGYSRPWTGELAMNKRPPESDNLYEYACHEGNYALTGILAGARLEEVRAELGLSD